MKKYILYFAFLCISFVSKAQYPADTNDVFYAKANVRNSSIQLRWMVSDYRQWRLANLYGYKITRETIARDKKKLPKSEFKNLTPIAIKPLSKELWKGLDLKIDQQQIAYDLLYGNDENAFDTTRISRANQDVQDVRNLQLYIAGLCADMNPVLASYMGLRLMDKDYKSAERYHYRIWIDSPKPIADTLHLFVSGDFLSIPDLPQNVEMKYEDNVTTISWDHSATSPYSAYFVERSVNDGKTFRNISEQPIVVSLPDNDSDVATTIFRDSIKVFRKTYLYRLRGITMFGEASPMTPPTAIYAYQCFIPEPQNLNFEVINNNQVNLSWTFPDSLQKEIKGFEIEHSNYADSAYTKLNQNPILSIERTFTDFKPIAEGFYRVAAINSINQKISSLHRLVQLKDSIPPYSPIGLKGKINKKGIVSLEWQADSLEKVYYKIYRGDAKKSEFVLVSGLVYEPAFKDSVSLALLNKDIFYFVQSYDVRSNPSDHFDTLKLKRPDIIPPSPPTFNNFKITDSTIVLSWFESSSNDVIFYNLLRKSAKDSIACVVLHTEADSRRTAFVDDDMEAELDYTYSLVAYDDGDLQSALAECQITLARLKKTVLPEIKEIVFEVDNEKKTIKLNWTFPSEKVNKFVIFRKKGPYQQLSEYKFLDKQFNTFLDVNVEYDTAYQYCIMAYLTDGSVTTLSKPYFAAIKKPE